MNDAQTLLIINWNWQRGNSGDGNRAGKHKNGIC